MAWQIWVMLCVRCFPNDILAEDKGSLHSHLWPLEFQKDSTISRVQEMKPGTKFNQLDPEKGTSFVFPIHPHRAGWEESLTESGAIRGGLWGQVN